MLWDFALSMVYWCSDFWEKINSPIVVGFNIPQPKSGFLSAILGSGIDKLNSIIGGMSFTFVPLEFFISGMIITLFTLFLIKSFIPMA